MTASLQEQLQYLDRTINPDYIIIVKNKADEKMTFDNFRVVIPENRERYKPTQRYNISCMEQNGKILILVKDIYSNNRVVYQCTCSKDYLEINLDKVKELYKGCDILDKL